MKKISENQTILALILIYFLFFGTFTALRHYNFQTQAWDLAIFSQSLWNTLHGEIFSNTLEEIPKSLGVHFSPILFLLVPGYAIFPTPYFLLIIQTLALGLGAWPLYFLAKKVIPQTPWPLIISAGYLFYPALHWINIFDFHPVAFAVPLFLAAFYFTEIKNWRLTYLFLALAAATREDAIPVVAFVGIYLFLRAIRQKNKTEMKIGFTIIVLSTLYFILVTKIFMPALGGGLLRIDRYAQLGQTPAEIISNLPGTIFTIPKLSYLFWLFLPVAFLPIFSGLAFLPMVSGLIENLLTNYQHQFSSIYHYDSVLIASIFFASVYGLKKLLEKWPNKEKYIRWLVIAVMLSGYIFRSPVNPVSFPIDLFKTNPHWAAFRQIISLVPKDPNISVAAQTNLVPHFSNREHAYMLGREPFPTDIVLIDGADLFGFKDEQDFQNYVDNYLNSGNYSVRQIDDRYLILIRNKL